MTEPALAVQIGSLKLKNPVMTASGTFGYGHEFKDFYDVNNLGAIVVKAVTLEPRIGNKTPRIAETPAGILNAIGLQNPGLEVFLKKELPGIQKLKTPVIVNIAGYTIDEYRILAERLDGIPGLAALEVNISCPNVKRGGQAFGTDPKIAYQVVRQVRQATKLPVIAKLSPNVTNITEIALKVEEAGADAVSLINTLLGMAIDAKTRRPVLGNIVGGLSGPAVKPVALRMVWQVAQVVQIPVIGMGGIASAEDAVEFLLAGATAVSIGTANFINPMTPMDIIAGIRRYLVEQGLDSVQDIIGKLVLS
jgi:dihydroorotate dehydrogenase (NAD+) catalytic subunit